MARGLDDTACLHGAFSMHCKLCRDDDALECPEQFCLAPDLPTVRTFQFLGVKQDCNLIAEIVTLWSPQISRSQPLRSPTQSCMQCFEFLRFSYSRYSELGCWRRFICLLHLIMACDLCFDVFTTAFVMIYTWTANLTGRYYPPPQPGGVGLLHHCGNMLEDTGVRHSLQSMEKCSMNMMT